MTTEPERYVFCGACHSCRLNIRYTERSAECRVTCEDCGAEIMRLQREQVPAV